MEKYNSYASEQTLGPSRSWTEMNDETRLAVVKDFFENHFNNFGLYRKMIGDEEEVFYRQVKNTYYEI